MIRILRELKQSRCTGFCKYLNFTRDASDREQNSMIRIVLSSKGI